MKKIIFIYILLLFILVLSGCQKDTLFNGNPSDILPSREEIATEWVMGDVKEVTSDWFKDSVVGFISGNQLIFERLEFTTLSQGILSVYKFNNIDNANNYYNNKVNNIKQEGGYTELDYSSIPADCFADKGGNAIEGFYHFSICKKKNIVFMNEIDSFNMLRLSYNEDITKIMAEKI
ncbi:MAG: hypothetical protein H8D38_01920 [DPANN group archaeon]|nr:hypothetical protein [DPANN group archaeon]